ncbi:MAG: L-threonylcarbamoyladenylate synthase [Bdellovibrionales bacterium]|nr:L-threonylcarbamoyladenylate synthase [Bdellovibrionales bacterium]
MKHRSVSLNTAGRIIQEGGVVAIPTETVYGLAGSVFSEPALKKIFRIKKRPVFNPLIVHCADARQMREFHNVNHPLLEKMVAYFSPGPLTFILDKTKKVHPLITAGQVKVGLRIPQHPVTLELIKKTRALCAPSANLFSRLSPTRAEHVQDIFKGTVPVLDGGECKGGIESTVLEPDFNKHVLNILRPGLISKEDLQKWLKKENQKAWSVRFSSSSLSPGQLNKHYRPEVPLVIVEVQKTPTSVKKEIELYLSSFFPGKFFKKLILKKTATLSARMLYHEMNILSQNPSHVIYVVKDKNNRGPSWKAIWDRLDKACSRKFVL